MKDGNAIEVCDITKAFRVYLDRSNNIKDFIIHGNRRRYENRRVLRGISFEVKRGEAIGLIGHNGCGKSTTLKLLTRIMYPDSGSIEMGGRVSSLIELGAGFHPDMSGRENIYINASIFGLSKKEIDNRLADIIAFSELEDFIDNPVRTYSSGMYMRLAFSVAINVDADILLIDEILAVGDVAFQAKCFNKLKEIKAQGTTIVIVSHALNQIEEICERTIWIHDGVIREEGDPFQVHRLYLEYMSVAGENKEKNDGALPLRWGNGKGKVTQIRILDEFGKERDSFQTGEDIIVQFDYEMQEYIPNGILGFGIFRDDGTECYGSNTRIDKVENIDLSGKGTAEVVFKNAALLGGKYQLSVSIEQADCSPVDFWREAKDIWIQCKTGEIGTTRMEHEWKRK